MNMFSRALLLLALLMLGTTPAFALDIIGHRGSSREAPENTLLSFKLGYQQNADAVELDIHLTKDGKIVVIHDDNTARTAGVSRKVADSTFDELRSLDVGRWKGEGFFEKIPSLDEVLALVPDGKRLFVELKCGAEVLPELENTLHRAGTKPDQIVLIGFDYATMRQAKSRFPKLQVCGLASRNSEKKFPAVEDLIDAAIAANLDGLDLDQGFPIEPGFVQKVHQAGLKLYTWTVDDPAVARKQAAAGVDGITTNRPGWLREQLTSPSGSNR